MLRKVLIMALASGLLALPALAQQGVPFELRQWASSAEASSEYGSDSWSALQAAGAPDAVGCGDAVTAWASLSTPEQASLTLMFDVPVVPTQVNIHQNYNPGSITGIDLIANDGGGLITVTDSGDPGGIPCPGILTIAISGDAPLVNGVVIYLDQIKPGNWNEIDAVELVGTATPGTEVSLWADDAVASSEYGSGGRTALQATSAPDTETCGDATSAWTAATSTSVEELRVYFPVAVIPTQLDIYQTFNPGAITGVDLLLADDSIVPVSNSADPGTPCPGVMSLSIDTEVAAVGVAIHLDQSITGSWNEIDAVQLTGVIAVSHDLIYQWATGARASSQYSKDSWSALQATGEPNTDECGDFGTAWASETATEEASLTVRFDVPVIPTSVHIYQTYNPGSITGIELIPADDGAPVTVTGSGDPGGIQCPGVLVIDITGDVPPVNGVIIHLDQSIRGSWNEIDAVQLIGRAP